MKEKKGKSKAHKAKGAKVRDPGGATEKKMHKGKK